MPGHVQDWQYYLCFTAQRLDKIMKLLLYFEKYRFHVKYFWKKLMKICLPKS